MGALHHRLADARVLDLFAGTGALGLEALSRGAAYAEFVERGRSTARVLEANIRSLGAEGTTRVIHGEALKHVEKLEAQAFDLAVADPPYGKGLEVELFERFAAQPFASELWVEHRTRDPVPQLPGLVQRRYGDTTLSHLFASDLTAAVE